MEMKKSCNRINAKEDMGMWVGSPVESRVHFLSLLRCSYPREPRGLYKTD